MLESVLAFPNAAPASSAIPEAAGATPCPITSNSRQFCCVPVPSKSRTRARRLPDWYTGRRYAFDGQSQPFARFSFAWLNERELPEAVKRIAAARP